jgi:primary-amine oxidase
MDVPSTRNDTSVLLGGSCCTTSGDRNKAAVQNDPVTHLQGSGAAVSAKEAGANVDEKLGKRLSKTFTGLFGSKKEVN